jgi:hypothetical protein
LCGELALAATRTGDVVLAPLVGAVTFTVTAADANAATVKSVVNKIRALRRIKSNLLGKMSSDCVQNRPTRDTHARPGESQLLNEGAL